MTQRQTREERERWNARIAFTRQGFSSFTRSLVEIVAMAGIAGGLTQMVQEDFSRVLAGAGWAAIAVLFLSLALAAVILLAWLGTRGERAEAEDDWPGVRTGPRTITMLPESWGMAEYRRYMAAIRDNEARFSERGAREFGGFDADKFKALLQWVIDRGWYATRNEGEYDNGNSGDWQVEWSTIIPTTPTAPDG